MTDRFTVCSTCERPLTDEDHKQWCDVYERCLDHRPGEYECSGEVRLRDALSASGTSFPRCDRHWGARLVKAEEDNRNYPDSPIAPSWFDPTAAGERWDSDY